MAQKYRKRRQIGSTLSEVSTERLTQISHDTQIPKARLLDKAITLLHTVYEEDKEQVVKIDD